VLYESVTWGITGCQLSACNAAAELLWLSHGESGSPYCLWHAEELLERLEAVAWADAAGVDVRGILRPVDGEL
jgi:hypothetical protein